MNADEQANLLRWARWAIEQAVRGENSAPVDQSELTDNLRALRAAFVTLKKRGKLRGCIGQMDFARPLWENVIAAAIASALEDSRFDPVLLEELPELKLGISVLERPVDLPRIEDFDAQRHGIIVQRGARRALLLPKVAQEYGWNAEQVLECVCQKAGLPVDAWCEPGTRFQVFTAVDFGEAEVDD